MSRKRRIFGAVIVVALGGAALVAVKARARASDGSDDKPSPLRLGKVQVEPLQVSVREVGVVDPETRVDVKSSVSGRVTALPLREGAVVDVGTLLAEVEPDVTQAQSLSDVRSSVLEEKLKVRDAERELAVQKSLFDQGLLGREAYRDSEVKRELAAERLKASRARYQIVEDHGIPISAGGARGARVTSPMRGVIIKKGVELGETVTSGVSSFSAGTVLFTVADLGSLIVRVNLNEVDIAKVGVGQPVRVTLDAYPQKVFAGRVRFVAPAAKLVEKIKVFEVEVALDEADASFRTGMSANVEILGERRDKALSIPLEALQRAEGKTVVYRLKKGLGAAEMEKAREGLASRAKFTWLSEHWKEYFEAVPVTAGIATLERAEVIAGLRGGDEVSLEDPTRKRIEKDEDN